MRRSLHILVAILFAGCARDLELVEPVAEAETASQVRTRALDGAVYNEVVDAWMIPQADPYTLANFQAAYDNLAAGKSAQTLSKAQAAEFAAAKKLAPTHYALKIYPHDEEEQWRVEMTEDVQVAYIPFDWVQLSPEEGEKAAQAKTRSAAANTFAEKSPYTVTYDYTDATDGGPTGPVTYQLPILYTVWPASKPLPTDLEYVVDYEVFLPHAVSDSSLSEQAMRVLAREAVSLATGRPTVAPDSASTRNAVHSYGPSYRMLWGRLLAYDNTLQAAVPMANLKVTYQEGSYSYTTRTADDGLFAIPNLDEVNFGSAEVTLTYQDTSGKWKITAGGTAPHTVSQSVSGSGHAPYPESMCPVGNRQANEIHRAVNYYYYIQNVFPKHTMTGGTVITAFDSPLDSNPTTRGSYGYYYENTTKKYYIYIYNRGGDTDSYVIGATLHELGHLAHDVAGNVWDTHRAIRESFANYFGWYLGENYYISQGRTQFSGALDITGVAFQDWDKTKLQVTKLLCTESA